MTDEVVDAVMSDEPAEIELDSPEEFRFLRATRTTLFNALLKARSRKGGAHTAIIDADGRTLTYDQLIQAALVIGRPLCRGTKKGDAVAVLLPTGVGAAIGVLGLLAYGRVPAMLNFTAGARSLKAAMRAAEAKRIITARRFIDQGGFQALADALSADAELIYLDEERDKLSTLDKLIGAAGAYVPSLITAKGSADDPGVILFTSGTEGDPKGVVLTHQNVIANVEQIRQHIELYDTDVLYNPLPTFHCFGLTVGLFTPLLIGVPVALHPTPLQAKIIAQRVREVSATFLLATDTFLNQYARAADEGDLSTLRLAVCGAERVRDETRANVKRKFGLEVLEGYGATEASPVIAANQIGGNRAGTVGRLLPGMRAKLVVEPGIQGSRRLFVSGPNVMKGYLKPSAPGQIEPLPGGWHDTGDIVAFDEEDFITIKGRVKRFAKIGGEMVSLAVVENCASTLWPDYAHAAVTAKDPRKGETIVLVTSYENADRGDLLAFAQNHGVPELAVPKKILKVDEIPVLGTGKVDYPGVARLLDKMKDDKAA